MNNKIINREVSWLNFNERVLMEALDENNPLLERLKFIAIFSSNLDEFFMVRVSGLYEQIDAGYDKPDLSGLTPGQKVQEIATRAKRLNDLQQTIFAQLKQELEKEHIFFPDPSDREFRDTLESIFLDDIMPVISPVTVDTSHPFPFIYSRRISIIVELTRNTKECVSLIALPETLRRIYKVRKRRNVYIFMVEDIIQQHISMLLKGYEIKNVSFFRVTRDADLDVTEEESEDLLSSIEHSLSERKRGEVIRAEVSSGMPQESLRFLEKMVGFNKNRVYFVNGAIDLTFLFGLCDLKESLMFPPLKQHPLAILNDKTNIFELIKEKPIYFFRPYNSFSLVAGLIANAAKDPDVLAIKMTLYRTNKNSRIIASLANAARQGKQVSVVVELKARFDEERNIEWAKNLEEAGCIVTYGIVGMKIHAKCMLIVRREEERIVRYTHIATGNYNEITANIYTDIDFITADDRIGRDATQFFNYLMGFTEEKKWSLMKIAPFMLRRTVVEMIDKEIEFAKSGQQAKIIIKINSLIDEEIINKLYEASDAGVQINLIIRGICGIMPKVQGLSDNIRVISIIGRFLEHARILYFYHGGAERYFITSADLMPRNLNWRVELMTEITDAAFKQSLNRYLSLSLTDNCKAWELHVDEYVKLAPPEGVKGLNSQEHFLNSDELI
ncbi:MAG: polyphosphate kinase 1 [Deferribacteraceae bacterium]|jgi:polyphosphate kinase|nr:polyphosphate kinase 1 [Deferribacteraceae bacterium]